MFEENQNINSLTSKVQDLLTRYEQICEQNENLRQELVSVKAQNEAKDMQITKLQEELQLREMESEDIFGKIEAVLNK